MAQLVDDNMVWCCGNQWRCVDGVDVECAQGDGDEQATATTTATSLDDAIVGSYCTFPVGPRCAPHQPTYKLSERHDTLQFYNALSGRLPQVCMSAGRLFKNECSKRQGTLLRIPFLQKKTH
ncbi:unnamed protein product [Haemonchus placei]|uniref:VWFD domain-containing protein n=1 Tax=Haemonchus placei TaxID=6290 RepID=A0A0N4WUN4_HAEPC|nr:unnamed protein product [Haemonchus placei]